MDLRSRGRRTRRQPAALDGTLPCPACANVIVTLPLSLPGARVRRLVPPRWRPCGPPATGPSSPTTTTATTRSQDAWVTSLAGVAARSINFRNSGRARSEARSSSCCARLALAPRAIARSRASSAPPRRRSARARPRLRRCASPLDGARGEELPRHRRAPRPSARAWRGRSAALRSWRTSRGLTRSASRLSASAACQSPAGRPGFALTRARTSPRLRRIVPEPGSRRTASS